LDWKNIFQKRYSKDIRELGSGNAGATNSFRAFGWKAGVFVLLFDSFKGWAAVMLAGFLMKEAPYELIANIKTFSAVAAVIGHIFPLPLFSVLELHCFHGKY